MIDLKVEIIPVASMRVQLFALVNRDCEASGVVQALLIRC
jgi:hypothetical protein